MRRIIKVTAILWRRPPRMAERVGTARDGTGWGGSEWHGSRPAELYPREPEKPASRRRFLDRRSGEQRQC